MKLFEFFKSIIGLILSLFVLIKTRILNKKKGYYLISNNEDLIDKRSLVYLNSNNLKDGIAIVRSQNFLTSIKLFFKYRNTILFNYIINFNEIIGFFLNNKNKNLFLKFFIKYLNLNEIHSIDDYRNIKLISDLCEDNRIKLFIYQHGRLSTSLSFQKNLSNLKYEKYFVWSLFFKKKLIEFNRDYRFSNIQVKKRFNFLFLKKKIKNYKEKILIIQENEINFSKIKDIILRLNKKKKYKLFFKFRPNSKFDNEISSFLKKNEISFFHKENIYELMKKKNFDFLLAFNSTLLLESSYFNILPVLLYETKPKLYDYFKDDVFFTSNIKNIDINLNKIQRKRKKLTRIKKILWSSN